MIYFEKLKLAFGIKAEGTEDSCLYSLDPETEEVGKFRQKTGKLMEHQKLSKDIFENYLSIMISPTSFIIMTDLDTKFGATIGPQTIISKSRIDCLVGVKLYNIENIIAVGSNGVFICYSIINGTKVKPLYERRVQLNKNEKVDLFDVLKTGEMIAFATKSKGLQNKALRILIYAYDQKRKVDKVRSFNFWSDPEKYRVDEMNSQFFGIYINQHIYRVPIVIAFKGCDSGAKCSIFVSKVDRQQLSEIIYLEEFSDGEFISSTSHKGKIYLLDSNMSLSVLSLPVKG